MTPGATEQAIRRCVERLERLDARAKASPGQLGFDLTGGSGTGPGGGERCGNGWIAPTKTCRKEEGSEPQKPSSKPYRPTPQVKAAMTAKPMSLSAGGDIGFDPAAEKKKAAGGLKVSRSQRGNTAKQNYFFRDRQAAEHWYADQNAKSDADIEVGADNRRAAEWKAEYRAAYEGTRNMLRDASDRDILETIEAYAMAGSGSRGGTATDVRIGGNAHSRPIREGTFGKQAATTKRPSLEEAITSQIQAGAEGRDAIIAELKTYGVELSQEEADEILSSDLADMLEAQQMIAAQKRRQAQASSNVLTSPGRRDPGLAPKAKPQGISASEVTTSKQQAQLARQQQAAAKASGDKRGAEAWRKEERTVERDRLAAAISGKQQSQTSLFGVTEYDETMPLFKQRRDSTGVDPVAQLIGQVLEEQLPGAQVLDWAAYPRGITAGRVASEGLVYRFRCDAAEIGYRPAWEGISERQWEQRSEGFLTARDPSVRVDFKGLKFQQQRSKRKCSKGYGCGSACISLNKECRVAPKSAASKARLRALQTLAREGDPAAEQMAASVQAQRDTKAKGLREGRQVDQLKKLMADPRVAEMVRTGRVPESQAAAPKPGDVRNVSPDGIEVDPERFQYKIGASKTGEVGSLSGVQKWDPNLAGVISVWQDPADGKTYVINGHNRLGLARRLGAEEVTVRFLKAADAKEARAIGAMQNIAEGAGKDTDAAKFFRDSGITSMDQVKAKGLPLNSGRAERGLALAQLPDEIFQDVIQGNLRTRRAAVIGGSGLDQDKQREVYKVLKQRPSMTDETLAEYVEHLAVSSRQTQTEIDLFGKNTKTVDTGLARAELSNGLKKALGREARLLGAVSKNSQAVELLEQRGGNTINVEQSQQQAQEASSVLRVFNQLKSSGAVGSALDQAAQRLMAGEKRSTVQKELRESVIQAMEDELKALGLKKPEPTNEAPTMSMFDSADPIENLSTWIGQLQNRMDKGAAGPGGGQQCGESWIDPDKTCRKNTGSTSKSAEEKLSEIAKNRYADRTATRNQVIGVVSLDEPIKVKASFKADDGKVINYERSHNDARYEVELKNYTNGAEDFRKKVGDAIGVDLSGSQVWDAAFMTGLGNSALSYSRNALMPPDAAKKISRAIRLELDAMISGLDDNTLVTCTPWTEDGLGDKRRKLYERAGFYTYSEKGSMVAIVRQGRLAKPSEFGIGRKDADDQINIEQLVYGLIMLESQGKASRTRQDSHAIFDRLEQRLDAIKRKCSTGYACGNSCISPAKDCRSVGKASTGKERLRKLEQAASGGKVGRGIGQLRGEAAAAKAEEIRGARSAQAATLRQQRAQRPGAGTARQQRGGALVAPRSTTITAPGAAPAGQRRSSLADTFKASVDQMKAADIKQMGILAEQLFETRWTLQKDNEWKGVSKEVARNQFQQDFLKRMQDQSQSPEAQERSQRLQQKMAASGSISGALGALLEDMKGSDGRIEDLGRKTFELRRQSIDLEASGDLGPRAGLRGRGNSRRLRGRKDSSDRLDAAIDRLMRISEVLTA